MLKLVISILHCLHPNKVIQNYKVSHLLGSGGMGEVWAGTHLYMNRKVAIKSLHSRLVGNREIRQRFKNEAVTMSELQHPTIVRLYDFIEEPDGLYLVMEFVDGDPLDEYILRKSGPIPEDRALRMFSEILEGMHYAHSQGILHRDIKPSNFMVTRDGHMKILDFGIAKLLEGTGQQNTKTGARIGTVLYMSPEQVKGHPLDQRSDVYSLGVTLFQMVTGQGPYRADATEYEIYQQIINQPLPRARSLYPAVSDRVQAMIDKAAAKHPDGRFQDCRLFLDAILYPDAVSLENPSARVQTPVQNRPAAAPKARRKKRKGWKWLTFLVLLGGLAVAGYVWVWPMMMPVAARGPKEVAADYLEAVEWADVNAAANLVEPSCRAAIFDWPRMQQRALRRRFEILKEEKTSFHAKVYYHYEGEEEIRSLVLDKRSGFWEVNCP